MEEAEKSKQRLLEFFDQLYPEDKQKISENTQENYNKIMLYITNNFDFPESLFLENFGIEKHIENTLILDKSILKEYKKSNRHMAKFCIVAIMLINFEGLTKKNLIDSYNVIIGRFLGQFSLESLIKELIEVSILEEDLKNQKVKITTYGLNVIKTYSESDSDDSSDSLVTLYKKIKTFYIEFVKGMEIFIKREPIKIKNDFRAWKVFIQKQIMPMLPLALNDVHANNSYDPSSFDYFLSVNEVATYILSKTMLESLATFYFRYEKEAKPFFKSAMYFNLKEFVLDYIRYFFRTSFNEKYLYHENKNLAIKLLFTESEDDVVLAKFNYAFPPSQTVVLNMFGIDSDLIKAIKDKFDVVVPNDTITIFDRFAVAIKSLENRSSEKTAEMRLLDFFKYAGTFGRNSYDNTKLNPFTFLSDFTLRRTLYFVNRYIQGNRRLSEIYIEQLLKNNKEARYGNMESYYIDLIKYFMKTPLSEEDRSDSDSPDEFNGGDYTNYFND